jgi:pSer/pThr/pTyr-binding forkhead associated (FHA) protein
VSIAAGETVVFGRDPEAADGVRAEVVPGDNTTVSKTHLRVSFDGDQLSVEDLHSKNGSVIDHHGQLRVLSPGTPTAVSAGDRIEIGATCFVVQ